MSLKGKIALWFAGREIRKQAERFIGRPLSGKERKIMSAIINAFANWKTTLTGVALGAITYIQGGMDWKHAVMGSLLAVLGIASKDSTTGSKAISK